MSLQPGSKAAVGRVVKVLALSSKGRRFEPHYALCSRSRLNGSVGALVLFHVVLRVCDSEEDRPPSVQATLSKAAVGRVV